MAGSGNLDGASPPVNEAVLLDARTGEVLARQRKVHPFNFSPSPAPVGSALAVAPGQAAVGHSTDPDDVVVFALDADGPRVEHERAR